MSFISHYIHFTIRKKSFSFIPKTLFAIFFFCFLPLYIYSNEKRREDIKFYLRPGARVILPGGFDAVRLLDTNFDNITDGIDLNKDKKLDLLFQFKDKKNLAIISSATNKIEFFLYLNNKNTIIIYYNGEKPKEIIKINPDRKLIIIEFWESSALEISGGISRSFTNPFITPYLYTTSISYSRGLDNLYQNIRQGVANRNQGAPGIKILADFVGYITPTRRVILVHLEAGLLWKIAFSKFSYGFLSPSLLFGVNYRESFTEVALEKIKHQYTLSYHTSMGLDYIFPINSFFGFTAGVRSRIYFFYGTPILSGSPTGFEYQIAISSKVGVQFLF